MTTTNAPAAHANDRNVYTFDSPVEALRGWYHTSQYSRRSGNESEWYGETERQTIDRCTNGDTSALANAMALMGKLSPAWTAPAIQMVPEVYGAFPCVPEYLAGEPECMRTLVTHADASAPIRLFVDLTSSGGITAANMTKRGTTILALALTLASVRPVEVHAFCTMYGRATKALVPAVSNSRQGHRAGDMVPVHASGVAVRLDLQGSLMAQSVYALTSVGFARRIIYDYCRTLGFDGNWASYGPFGAGFGATSSPAYLRACRWQLGCAPDDIVIPGISLYDKTTTNPELWLAEMLANIEAHKGQG